MMKPKSQLGSVLALTLSLVAGPIHAQAPSVTVDQPYAGDRNITGQGVPGSGPLTVYEVLGTARNYLGKSTSVDQQGFYAVSVSPVLVAGHQIVVVDAQGHSSNISTVIVKSGPAGPGGPAN